MRKIIVVDTETTNSLDEPLCYDVGFAVIDIDTNTVIEEHSYVVAEIFLDKDLMKEAFFAEKIPNYWEDIKSGKRRLCQFSTIRRIFRQVCKRHQIEIVAAHNARFDYRSLNLTQRYLTCSKYRFFFPYGVEIWDTLKMAREVLKENESYGAFCYENDFLTSRGVCRYTAEIIFRFLSSDISFSESHTGLEDVKIEKEIFVFCLSYNPEINGRLWE